MPPVTRGTNSNGEPLVVIPGLPAGKYEVVIGAHRGGPINPNRDTRKFEADGAGDVELTYDLR